MSTRTFTLAALSAALLVACGLSLFASGHPDGLEFVAQSLGFMREARDTAASGSPLAGYSVVGVASPWLSAAIAGALGCAVTFGSAVLLGSAARRRKPGQAATNEPAANGE